MVSAGIYDLAIIEDDDGVRGDDGAEAMGDEEAGSALHKFGEGLVDFHFAVGVDLAHGFIENENLGVFENCPCDNDSLELSAREAGIVFSNESIVSFGQFFDELMRVCFFRSGYNFFRCGVRTSVANVCHNGVVEGDDVLCDHTDLVSEAFCGSLVDVLSID